MAGYSSRLIYYKIILPKPEIDSNEQETPDLFKEQITKTDLFKTESSVELTRKNSRDEAACLLCSEF